MKYVVVPENVYFRYDGQPVHDQNGKPVVWSHEKFVSEFICTSPTMNRGGGDGLRRVVKMLRLFESAKAGDVIGIEDADYKVARSVVDSIEWPAPIMRFAHQMLPHVEAWEHAEKHDEAWKKEYDVEHSKKPALRAVEDPVAADDEAPKAG